MGMTASAYLWYGVRVTRIPDELDTELENSKWGDSIEVDGIDIRKIWAYDILIGFGSVIEHNDMGYAHALDIGDLADKFLRVEAAVDKTLARHGFQDDDPDTTAKLYLEANLS